MSALFNNVSCGSLRPFPLHAARVRVRGALFFGDFLLARQKKVTSRRSVTGVIISGVQNHLIAGVPQAACPCASNLRLSPEPTHCYFS